MEMSEYQDENAITPIVEKTFLDTLGINPSEDDIKGSHSALAIESINGTCRVINDLNEQNARSRERMRVELAENVSLAVDNIVKSKQLKDKDSILETIVKYKSDISSISEERIGYQKQIETLKLDVSALRSENANQRQSEAVLGARIRDLEAENRKLASVEKVVDKALALLGDSSSRTAMFGKLKNEAERELIANLELVKEIIYG